MASQQLRLIVHVETSKAMKEVLKDAVPASPFYTVFEDKKAKSDQKSIKNTTGLIQLVQKLTQFQPMHSTRPFLRFWTA